MRSCLVVDDSPVIRKIARRILEEMEFDVSEAEDGIKALENCMSTSHDLIILDWNMPEMSGIEFLENLRAKKEMNQPIVIFCTTESSIDHIRKAIELGANEYIMKPFDREIIEAKLSQVGLL